MPIVGKRRVVDKETGQTVEGLTLLYISHINLLIHLNLDWDMVFADDERESNPTSFKFLQMAHAWKKKQAAGGAGAAEKPSVLSGFAAATETSQIIVDEADSSTGNGKGNNEEASSDESD